MNSAASTSPQSKPLGVYRCRSCKTRFGARPVSHFVRVEGGVVVISSVAPAPPERATFELGNSATNETNLADSSRRR